MQLLPGGLAEILSLLATTYHAYAIGGRSGIASRVTKTRSVKELCPERGCCSDSARVCWHEPEARARIGSNKGAVMSILLIIFAAIAIAWVLSYHRLPAVVWTVVYAIGFGLLTF